jgi:phosphoglycolate phosphatase
MSTTRSAGCGSACSPGSVALVTHLVLWDIDHTLVDLSRFGADLYAEAFLAITGTTMRALPGFGGRTERAITTEILHAHGIEATEDVVRALWRELVDRAVLALATPPAGGRALPGAAAALSSVAGHDGVVQSLVTGNLPEISRRKLEVFGLHEHIDFEIGGYGSLSAHRPDLVPHALRNAETKHGKVFGAVVVIGDTPNDVAAALANGAKAVAVASGFYDEATLEAAGAHVVFPDLADTEAVTAALLG